MLQAPLRRTLALAALLALVGCQAAPNQRACIASSPVQPAACADSLGVAPVAPLADIPQPAFGRKVAYRQPMHCAVSLRVVTYNVQLLPRIARWANKRGDAEYRGGEIGRQLSHYDLIGLNELFDSTARRKMFAEIKRSWGEDFHVATSRPPPGRFSAGLAIVSRLPIIQSHELTYSRGSSIFKYGVFADSFAAKGVLHARVAASGDPDETECLDVFVTHLESKGQEREIRSSQCQELARFVQRHSHPQRPAVIMGDFNIDGRSVRQGADSEHAELIRLLRSACEGKRLVDLGIDCANAGTTRQDEPAGGKRIDYILLAVPKDRVGCLQWRGAQVNRFHDPRVDALSDHSAVQAELLWQP